MVDSDVDGAGLWRRAVSLGARLHAGQFRRDGRTPYFAHPCRVAMTVRDVFGCDDAVCIAAALLHDVIEDTPADFDEVCEACGEAVAEVVSVLTKDMSLAESARERRYDERLLASGWRARLIKLGDVLDNMADTGGGLSRGSRAFEKAERALSIARAWEWDGEESGRRGGAWLEAGCVAVEAAMSRVG